MTQRRRFAAASTPSGSSTTTGRRHACSHLERWRRRREGRAEDRGDTARRGDLRVPAGRCPGDRGERRDDADGGSTAARGRASIWARRSAVGIRHRNRIRSLLRLRPKPLLSVLRARAKRHSTKAGARGRSPYRPPSGVSPASRCRGTRSSRSRSPSGWWAPCSSHSCSAASSALTSARTAPHNRLCAAADPVAAGLTAAGTSPRSRSSVARGSIGARRGLQSDDAD